ncbi:hypothetical protein [Halomontanus rarus]|uniref:hypothetical protein n=1 Tax=Halomontanus rarus TaxID=3034020 RepID=UPI00307C3E53
MSAYLNGPRDPKNDGYPWGVRVTVGGIDCYSVGAESRLEAQSLESIMAAEEGVSDTEVVRYG